MRILTLILLLPIFSTAQQLDLVWKLKWGMKYDSAINFIKKSRNITPHSIKGDTSIMVTVEYRNQLFDGHKAFATLFYFLGNRLLRSEIFFVNESKDDSKTFTLFDSIKTKVTSKYFEPQYCDDAEDYTQAEKMKAIKQKDANYYCNWFFPKDDDSEKGGKLNLQITNQGVVLLIYDYAKADRIKNTDF